MKAAKIILNASQELRTMIINSATTEEILNKNERISNVICSLKPDEGYPIKRIEIS